MFEKLLVVDTETGGLDPLAHSILSVGAVVYRPGELLDRFEMGISEPSMSVQLDALRVNRMDLKALRETGLAPADAVAQFEKFLSGHFGPKRLITLAGHNVAFDIGFIKRLYRLAGANFERRFSHRSLDTASILSYLRLAGKIEMKNSGLDAALEHFQIDVDDEGRHTALADAEATAKLLNALLQAIR